MAKSRKPKPSFDGPPGAPGSSDTNWVYRSEPPAAVTATMPAPPIIDLPPAQTHAIQTTPSPTDDAVALNIVDRHAMYAAGAGLLPVPLIDSAAIAGVQFAMVRSLADHYSVPFSHERAKAVVSAIAGSVAPVSAGRTAMRFLMNHVPIAGTLFAYATVSVFASAVTFAVGRVFIRHFEAGGSLDDIDVEQSRQHVAGDLERSRT